MVKKLAMPRILDMTRSRTEDTAEAIPLRGTRAEAVQRLQIGIAGVVLMAMSVALAGLVRDRADEAEAAAPQPAPATSTTATAAPEQNDPLVEAGVVPDMPPDDAAPVAAPGVPPTDAAPVR